MKLIPLPAFNDNYIWLLHDNVRALVVDPGEAQPVFVALQQLGLQLASILVTHHHGDHVGGVAELAKATGAQVCGPASEKMPEPLTRLVQGDAVQALGRIWHVMDVPGHTAGHIAYFSPDAGLGAMPSPVLFCGDTLFSGGCGRLFEGTPAQMLASLDKLAALPGNTQVCCAHEYTLSNLRFACAVEPDNADLKAYAGHCEGLRARGLPTLPADLALELKINPFLRSRCDSVVQAAQAFQPSLCTAEHSDSEVFAAIREWKNQFK
ncbi:MAG: hydroxyacylglutathione hydrolase [Burkholderiaceae bacterium]|nr:hydroxyacylglutathione hydrolase [Burkholderiaceae bacterium]